MSSDFVSILFFLIVNKNYQHACTSINAIVRKYAINARHPIYFLWIVNVIKSKLLFLHFYLLT